MELTAQEAAWCAFALEGQFRRRARNGLGLPFGDRRRLLAIKLALAAPIAADTLCPALLRAAGPEVTARVCELAATELARQARQPAAPDGVTPVPPPGPLTAPEVGRLTGLTADAVRAAIRRGRLAADKESGEWRIERQAVDEWRAHRAA